MAKQSDNWHYCNLRQTLAHEGSNYNKFLCGNAETLSKEGIREKLLEFHKKWYSGNLMTVVVNSNMPMDDLRKMVFDKLDPIKNHNAEIPDLMDPEPWTKENQGKLIRFVPIMDSDDLSFVWTLPYCAKEVKRQPLRYYTHLFGHEGPNSLLSWLRHNGLAHGLTATDGHDQWGMSTLELDIKLTKKGLKEYKKIAEAVSQYSRIINHKRPQPYIFQENKELGQIMFDYADKDSAVNTAAKVASRMHLVNNWSMPYVLQSAFVAT